jgi:hypothetical protein
LLNNNFRIWSFIFGLKAIFLIDGLDLSRVLLKKICTLLLFSSDRFVVINEINILLKPNLSTFKLLQNKNIANSLFSGNIGEGVFYIVDYFFRKDPDFGVIFLYKRFINKYAFILYKKKINFELFFKYGNGFDFLTFTYLDKDSLNLRVSVKNHYSGNLEQLRVLKKTSWQESMLIKKDFFKFKRGLGANIIQATESFGLRCAILNLKKNKSQAVCLPFHDGFGVSGEIGHSSIIFGFFKAYANMFFQHRFFFLSLLYPFSKNMLRAGRSFFEIRDLYIKIFNVLPCIKSQALFKSMV